jgi:mannose-6-phosphate isomerase-like protein (cupin superfamily)
VNYVYQPKS